MHLFTSTFIGIPLQERFVEQYQKLQRDVAQVLPNIDLANARIPHITLYYLGSQIVENVEEIMTRAKSYSALLHSEEVRCNGIDYFRHHDPKVLFVEVEHAPQVEQFYRIMCEALSSFRNEQDTRDFHAHMTLGRLRDLAAQEAFVRHKDEILKLGHSVEWTFTIEEIALYGVDAQNTSAGQQVLFKINI